MPVPVRLNIYDMYWLNEYANPIGFGIYHSGIEVYGVEYAYGGHQFPFSGIFTNNPQDAEELGETFKFKESIYLGDTALSQKSVEKLIKSLGDDYRGDRYHLILRNCNHFAAYLAKELTGVNIPGWVNRLASFSGSIPFLHKIVPLEWLTPMALERTFENSEIISDTSNTLNYPSNFIDQGIDAAEFCTDSPKKESKPLFAAVANGTTNGSTSGWSRPATATMAAQPTPTNSSRNNGSITPTLTRLWNSIRSIGPDDQVGSNTRLNQK